MPGFPQTYTSTTPSGRSAPDFRPTHVSDFADGSGTLGGTHDVDYWGDVRHDPDNFNNSHTSSSGGSNFGNPVRVRIDSLQSLPEEEFLEAIRNTYPQKSLCSRRGCILMGAILIFTGAAVGAFVGFAFRPSRVEGGEGLPGPVGASSGGGRGSDATADSGGRGRDGWDAEKCGAFSCCEIHPDDGGSCAVTKAADCVRYWDLCDDTGKKKKGKDKQQQESGSEEEEKEKEKSDVAIKLSLIDACSYTSLTTTEGLRLCKEACQDHMCCFELGSPETKEGVHDLLSGKTCRDDPGMDCVTYDPCGNLAVEEAEEVLDEEEAEQEEKEKEEGGDEPLVGREDEHHDEEERMDGGEGRRSLRLR